MLKELHRRKTLAECLRYAHKNTINPETGRPFPLQTIGEWCEDNGAGFTKQGLSMLFNGKRNDTDAVRLHLLAAFFAFKPSDLHPGLRRAEEGLDLDALSDLDRRLVRVMEDIELIGINARGGHGLTQIDDARKAELLALFEAIKADKNKGR